MVRRCRVYYVTGASIAYSALIAIIRLSVAYLLKYFTLSHNPPTTAHLRGASFNFTDFLVRKLLLPVNFNVEFAIS